MLSFLTLLAFSPAQAADDDVALEAERVRISEELEMMSRRGAWRGVDAMYKKLEGLAEEGATLSFDDHYSGVLAARSLGNLSTTYTRLKRAQALQATDEIVGWIAEIEASYGGVDLYVDPRFKDDFALVPAQMPFDPEQRGAIEAAANSLADGRSYEGILPHGSYTMGDEAFEVASGGEIVTVELLKGSSRGKERTVKDIKSKDEAEEFAFSYVGPRVSLGGGYQRIAESKSTSVVPGDFGGMAAFAAVGVEAGLSRIVGAYAEVGYQGAFGPARDAEGNVIEDPVNYHMETNQLHLFGGTLGGVYRANDLVFNGGVTFRVGSSKINGVSENCAAPCADLTDWEKKHQGYDSELSVSGFTLGGLYQMVPVGKWRGGMAINAGVLFDPNRAYPWGGLAWVVAPQTPRRR